MPNHVFANRGFGDLDTEFQELAVDSRRSPADIVVAQSPNQFTCFLWDTWSAWVSMPDLPGPVPTETPTVPVHNSSGFHNPEGLTLSGQGLGQCDPEMPIHRFQFRLGILSLKHKNLVSQGRISTWRSARLWKYARKIAGMKGRSRTWPVKPTPTSAMISMPIEFSGTTILDRNVDSAKA